MPVELEYKYLIDKDEVQYDVLIEKLISMGISYRVLNISQGYLPKAGRLRKITETGPSGSMSQKFIFTYKHKLSFQPGDLEIETEISEDDFCLGSSDCSFNIDKTRVVFNHGPYTWEVDFFNDRSSTNGHYLVLVECEVQDGVQPDLHFLLEYLMGGLQYRVPLGDSRFSNKNLSFIENAKNLYEICR